MTWPHRLVSGLVVGCVLALCRQAPADILFQDDFEDGVLNPIYTPVGNAILSETGGRLRIQMFSRDDGVSIAMPDNAMCILFTQEVPDETEFDRGEGWRIVGNMQDGLGGIAEGFELGFTRPFWNRCQPTIKVNGQECPAQEPGVPTGFWG